jgi:Mor family transcriptional regulator
VDYSTWNILIDDIGEPYQSIACVVGVEKTIKLAVLLRGKQVIFPVHNLMSCEYQEVVNCVGEEDAERIRQMFLGSKLYFPELRKCVDYHRMIIDEFNGYNQKELGKKYGLSTRYIYHITKEKRKALGL